MIPALVVVVTLTALMFVAIAAVPLVDRFLTRIADQEFADTELPGNFMTVLRIWKSNELIRIYSS